MPRIIHDNIPDLLSKDGKTVETRQPVDNREFFALLQRKMVDDISALSQETTVVGKAKRLADIQLALGEFISIIDTALKPDGSYDVFVSDRKIKVGTFSKRLVVDANENLVSMEKATPEQQILTYGQEHDWPELILEKNEHNKPYLVLQEGENNWRAAIQHPVNTSKILAAMADEEPQS